MPHPSSIEMGVALIKRVCGLSVRIPPSWPPISNPRSAPDLDDDPVHLVISLQAIAFIGFISGSLCAWPAADYFGRQRALKIGGIVSLCGWLFLYNSIRVTESAAGFQALLFTGRILTGFATGWFFPTVTVSIDACTQLSEAEPKHYNYQ